MARCEPRVKRLTREIDTMIDIQLLAGKFKFSEMVGALGMLRRQERVNLPTKFASIFLFLSFLFFLSSLTKVRRGLDEGGSGTRLLQVVFVLY